LHIRIDPSTIRQGLSECNTKASEVEITRYFIAIELPDDERTPYGVVAPDIPGCFSAGDTLDEAIANAEEAIVLQLEDMIDRNLELPEPSVPEDFLAEFSGWAYVGINVDPQQLSTKAKRINITIPEGALYLIDRATEKAHTNRSAFLYESALSRIQDRRVSQYHKSMTVKLTSEKTPSRRATPKKKPKRKAG